MNIRRITFIVLIFLSLSLSSFVLLDNSSLFTGPFMYDEKEVYIFANNLLRTGSLKFENQYTELNEHFEYPIAALTYSVWNNEKEISLPARAIGNYYLLAYSILLFGNNFQLIYIVMFIISGVVFGYSVSELFRRFNINNIKKEKTLILSSALYLTFFPFILWANTWFDYIPGFFFFVVSFYFILKYLKAQKITFGIIASFFMGLSFLFRYEYLLFALGLLATVYLLKRDKKIIYAFLVIFLFIITLLGINYSLYGSPFSFGYSEKNHVVLIHNADLLFEVQNIEMNAIEKIFYVYFADFFSPDKNITISNIQKFLINPFSVYLLLVVIGILFILKNLHRSKIIFSFFPILAMILLWAYYIFTGNFWGINNPTWIVNVYFRYSFPIFIFLLIGAAAGILYFLNNYIFQKKVLIVLLVVIIVTQNISILFTSDYGLDEISRQKNESYQLNAKIKNFTEENSLIWAPFYEKFIIDRYTLSPWYIIESKEKRIISVLNYTYKLLKMGWPIYYVSAPWHKTTYLALDNEFEKDERFNVELIDNTTRYKIYKITLAP